MHYNLKLDDDKNALSFNEVSKIFSIFSTSFERIFFSRPIQLVSCFLNFHQIQHAKFQSRLLTISGRVQ